TINNQVYSIKIVPVCNSNENLIYYATYLELITDKQKCRTKSCKQLDNFIDSLLNVPNEYKQFTDQLPAGLIKIDTLGQVIYANNRAQEKFAIKQGSNLLSKVGLSDQKLLKDVLTSKPKTPGMVQKSCKIKNKKVSIE